MKFIPEDNLSSQTSVLESRMIQRVKSGSEGGLWKSTVHMQADGNSPLSYPT